MFYSFISCLIWVYYDLLLCFSIVFNHGICIYIYIHIIVLYCTCLLCYSFLYCYTWFYTFVYTTCNICVWHTLLALIDFSWYLYIFVTFLCLNMQWHWEDIRWTVGTCTAWRPVNTSSKAMCAMWHRISMPS